MKEKNESDDDSCFSQSVSSENLEEIKNKEKNDLNSEKNNNDDNLNLNNLIFNNDNNNEDEEDSDNNINKIKQCNSYKSVFSFTNISKFDNTELNKINLNKNNTLEEQEKERQSGLNDNDITIWECIKQQLSNAKNHIVYNFNIFTGPNNLDLKDEKLPQEIYIFDQKFSKQDEKLINILMNIPWFSYRKNFNQIKDKDSIYTSDAGWGCMIRSSQMILAQGIYKIFSMKNLNNFFNEFITFFYDDKIPLKLLVKTNTNNIKNKDIKNNENKINKIKEKKEEKTYDDFLIIDITRETRISFIDVTKEMIQEFEKLSKEENDNNNCYVTPPFSLRNIIKTHNIINPKGKKVGEWFSNYDTIKTIAKINKHMIEQHDCDFKIINFENETIYIEDLIKECFEEVETQGFEYISKRTFDKNAKVNDTILNEEIINKNLKSDVYIFSKRRYVLKQKFIIFISVRHGLHSLNEDLHKEVLKFFDIKTNIGLIGGKNSRAFYFIGKCGNNLIFLDPHYVQQTIPLNELGTNKIEESYRPNDIYYMDISELSPSFSIGFAIKDMKDFKLFMEKMMSDDYYIDQSIYKSFGKKNNYLFMVKNYHFPYRNNDDSNQDISNNIYVKENFY